MTDDNLAVDEQETPVEQELSDEDQAKAKLMAAIDVVTEEVGSLRLKVAVTIPRDHLDERLDEQFAELKRDSDIPGFRKGHAPMRLVEKRFANDVGNQLKSQLVSSAFIAATEKEGLNTLGDPLFWISVPKEGADGEEEAASPTLLPFEKAQEYFTFPKDGDLSFACEVELKPEFDLPELKGIPIEKPSISISDEDVDSELKRMRMMRGTYKPVEGGKVEADDMLYADVRATVDGDEILSEENYDLAARDIQIKGIPMKGLGDALVGKKAGDEVSFEATCPDDFEKEEHRNKAAKFEFKLLEIKRLAIPEIDEEFLAGSGFDSEDELRTAMRSSLESRLDQTVNQAMHEQMGTYLVEQTKLEIPEGLSTRQTERTIARKGMEMLQQGVPATEVRKSLDEMHGQARDQVIKDLKLFFILEKVAEEMDVEIRDERFNAAIAQIAQRSGKRFDRVRDELSKGDGLTHLYLQLRDEQVLNTLLEDAKVTEAPAPKKATAKKEGAKKTATKAAASKKTTAAKTAPAKAAPAKTAKKSATTATKPAAKKTAKKTVKKKTKKSTS